VVFLRDGRVVDRLAGADAHEVADRLAAWER
jgi:putative ABC transport system ATP-binding protein